MTQKKIDSIRERMCDGFCKFAINKGVPGNIYDILEWICKACPLNELEASE